MEKVIKGSCQLSVVSGQGDRVINDGDMRYFEEVRKWRKWRKWRNLGME